MANLNLNKVILGGIMTADAELRETPTGVPVCSFTIAVNRKGKDAQTDFINCQAWRGTAEFISKYFSKGSSICIIGSLQQRTWTDKDGGKRYATEVIADEALFVDSKSDNAQGAYFPPSYASGDNAPNFEDIPQDDALPF